MALYLSLLAWILAWLAPNHYPPWQSFYNETLGFIATGLAVSAACFVTTDSAYSARSLQIEKKQQIIVTATLISILWALVTSQYLGDAIIFFVYFMGFSLAAYLMLPPKVSKVMLGETSALQWQFSFCLAAKFCKLCIALLVAALISSSIGIFQKLRLLTPFDLYLFQIPYHERAMGNLAQSNHLGTLLVMGIAASLYLFYKRFFGRLSACIVSAYLVIGLLLSESRTAILSVVVLSVWLVWKRVNSNEGWQVWIFPLLAAAIVGLHLATPQILEALYLSGRSDAGSRAAVSFRFEHLGAMLAAIAERPWFGWGLHSVSAAQQEVGQWLTVRPVTEAIHFSTNMFFDLVVWFGLPLGLLMVVAIVVWCYRRAKEAQSLESVFALALLIPMLVHSMLEYPHGYAYFLLFAGLLVGILMADSPSTKYVAVPMWLVRSVVLVWISLGVVVAYEYLKVEEDFRAVRFESMGVGSVRLDEDKPKIYALTQLNALLIHARTQARVGMSEQELDELKAAARRYNFAPLNFRYVLALAFNQQPDLAALEMLRLRGVYGSKMYDEAVQNLKSVSQTKPEVRKVLDVLNWPYPVLVRSAHMGL